MGSSLIHTVVLTGLILCGSPWLLWTGECNGHVLSRRQHFTALPHPLTLVIVCAPHSGTFSEPWEVVVDVLFRAEHLAVTYSRASPTTTVHCKEKHL